MSNRNYEENGQAADLTAEALRAVVEHQRERIRAGMGKECIVLYIIEPRL
jgi:hypothetical protein